MKGAGSVSVPYWDPQCLPWAAARGQHRVGRSGGPKCCASFGAHGAQDFPSGAASKPKASVAAVPSPAWRQPATSGVPKGGFHCTCPSIRAPQQILQILQGCSKQTFGRTEASSRPDVFPPGSRSRRLRHNHSLLTSKSTSRKASFPSLHFVLNG